MRKDPLVELAKYVGRLMDMTLQLSETVQRLLKRIEIIEQSLLERGFLEEKE